jgi:hypothetical protein
MPLANADNYGSAMGTELHEAAMPAEVTKTPVPAAITTPSRVEAAIGDLVFTDGYPTSEAAAKLRDHLDYLHGVETFMNTVQGVSTYALRQGFPGGWREGR